MLHACKYYVISACKSSQRASVRTPSRRTANADRGREVEDMPLGGGVEADEGQKVAVGQSGSATWEGGCGLIVTGPSGGNRAPLRWRHPILCNTTVYAILSPTDARNIPTRDSRVRDAADDPAYRQWKPPAVSDDERGTVVSGDKWHGVAGFAGDDSERCYAGGVSSTGAHLRARCASPVSIAKVTIKQL
jgi:hypothetical protein